MLEMLHESGSYGTSTDLFPQIWVFTGVDLPSASSTNLSMLIFLDREIDTLTVAGRRAAQELPIVQGPCLSWYL